jgi:hypothetical protein
MKIRNVLAMLLLIVPGLCAFDADAQITNSVGVSGFTYTFSTVGGGNPTLTLYRGVTYVFNITAIGHPFFIKTNISGGTTDTFNDGVVNNGAQSGTLTFVVPVTAPNQLSYNCSVHSTTFGMHGFLNILNPPAPPTGQIVLITLSPTSVTMQSIGATNWNPIPEYSSNLVSSTWAAVPNYTNVLANNTNTTTFDRLDAICGPNVFLRVRNQFP